MLRWPTHARYGKRAGQQNEDFLNSTLFESSFLASLEPYRAQVGVIIFEFGTFAKHDFATPVMFLARLEEFLEGLPRGWRYAVEIRNPDCLGSDYFSALARHNVAHVFNAWTRMPTLVEQIAISDSFTADFIVARALLKRGRTFEEAVKLFRPYERVLEPDNSTRDALRQIAERSLKKKQRTYVFVNNRLEGTAPQTITAVVGAMGA